MDSRRLAGTRSLGFALLAIACRTPTESLPPINVIGRYELLSVGGQPLPVTLPLGGPPRILLLADTLWLRADSTYEEHLMRQVIGPAPLSLLGTFSVTGRTIRLTQTGATESVPGSVADSSLAFGSPSWIYARRCSGAAC